jgi:hypothetical protein
LTLFLLPLLSTMTACMHACKPSESCMGRWGPCAQLYVHRT